MADDDPFGLGDFAVFLGDDPLPTRPSVLKEKEEMAEDLAYMTRKNVSPSKDVPAWKFGVPTYPHIARQRQEGKLQALVEAFQRIGAAPRGADEAVLLASLRLRRLHRRLPRFHGERGR